MISCMEHLHATYDVPVSPLGHRMHGKYTWNQAGTERMLSAIREEDVLRILYQYYNGWGFPPQLGTLRSMAVRLLKTK